jgi:hypothetical protein
MTRAEWQAIYQEAWTEYYSRAHVETLLRRAAASGIGMVSLITVLVPFMTMVPVEGVHPLQAGLFRAKHPSERRPGAPRQSALAFYPRYFWELATKNAKLAATIWWIFRIKWRIERDPKSRTYQDRALTPVRDDDEMTLDLLTKTSGVREALDHQRKIAWLTRRRTGTPADDTHLPQ